MPTPPGKPRIHAHVHMHTPAHSMLEGQKQETHGPLPSGRGGEWWSWTDLLVPKLTHCLRRGCYKKYTTVASTTSIYFSEFWRFCRPECQRVWALREDPFPVYRWPLSSVSSHGGEREVSFLPLLVRALIPSRELHPMPSQGPSPPNTITLRARGSIYTCGVGETKHAVLTPS